MTLYEFETQYATVWVDQFGTTRLFYPLHEPNKGAMETTHKDGYSISGTYTLREDSGNWYLGWSGKEFLFSPIPDGFQLTGDESDGYCFKRPD